MQAIDENWMNHVDDITELKKYIGATFLGMFPGAIAYNFLAGSFGTNKFYVAILVLLVAFGVPLVWWRRSGECKKIRERQ